MRLMRCCVLTALFAACLTMAGCGTTTKLKKFDRAANRDISTIALLDVDEPGPLRLVGQSGVDEKTLTADRAYRELGLGRRLTASLEAALTKAGYQVVHLRAHRQRPNDLLDDYAGIRSDADAIFDVAIDDGGYSQDGAGGVFAAYVVTKARLVKLPRRQIVYSEDAVTYSASGREAAISRGAEGPGRAGAVTRVEQPDVGVFRSAGEVTADPARAIRGFDNSATMLAAYYAKALAR